MKSKTPLLLSIAAILSCGGLTSCGGGGSSNSGSKTRFEVILENVSNGQTLNLGGGRSGSVGFSAFVLAVHSAGDANPFFTRGQTLNVEGVEKFAETAIPSDLIVTLQLNRRLSLIALASTPVGASGTALLGPGSRYRSVIDVGSDEDIAIASSFLQGNDLLVATTGSGVHPFDSDGNPVSGDFTSQFSIVDVGTEVNEAPGVGANQVLSQQSDDAGTSESKPVAAVSDGFTYPNVQQMLKVSIQPIS